jgi:hypothetical protein
MTHPFDELLRLPTIRETNPLLNHAEMMLCLGRLARNMGDGQGRLRARRVELYYIAQAAEGMLFELGVENPLELFKAEFEAAKRKHPGHTFDLTEVPDLDKYWALAEEVGEVAAALTYDNTNDTGHQADLIKEITQVGGLALAWLISYQKDTQA